MIWKQNLTRVLLHPSDQESNNCATRIKFSANFDGQETKKNAKNSEKCQMAQKGQRWNKNQNSKDFNLPISISLSSLPGRLSAGSTLSGRLVAAITTSPSVLLIPSIKFNNVATILWDNSSPPSLRAGAMASNSSMKTYGCRCCNLLDESMQKCLK